MKAFLPIGNVYKGRAWLSMSILMAICIVSACSHKIIRTSGHEQLLLSECSKDWLKFKIFELPAPVKESHVAARKRIVNLNIRIVNIMDNVSPLRKRCTDLDQYNTIYEYLLNGCKNEIYLQMKNGIAYPVSYSFENNYNAFPFESINVGYAMSGRKKPCKLIYVDRVFSQDTLSFPLNL